MSIKIVGYSERGMIAAICTDICGAPNPLTATESLLTLIAFPFHPETTSPFVGITHAEILIEQSFSTYGDPDLVFLVRTSDNNTHAVFVEAKVHTDVKAGRTIEKRWQFFENCLKPKRKKRPSGLFTQMYRSQRLIRQLENPDVNLGKDKFFGGTKLGRNSVVRKAAKKVRQFMDHCSVVALLPESADSVDPFFRTKLASFQPGDDLPDWNVKNWGYLTWGQVDTLCMSNPTMWRQTVRSFNWNHEQVYFGRRERKDLPPVD